MPVQENHYFCMTNYQNLQDLKSFSIKSCPFYLKIHDFPCLKWKNRPSKILLESSIICSKKLGRVKILLKSKNYCTQYSLLRPYLVDIPQLSDACGGDKMRCCLSKSPNLQRREEAMKRKLQLHQGIEPWSLSWKTNIIEILTPQLSQHLGLEQSI